MSDGERTLLVDASVWISLSEVGTISLLRELDGTVLLPNAVRSEIETDPGATTLDTAIGNWVGIDSILKTGDLLDERDEHVQQAASHLGVDSADSCTGDVALLALAFQVSHPVVITDDKPLRNTCKPLSIPVSGSIGVLIRAVECGAIEPDEAKSKLYAMDETGARFSATLVKRAEQLIDDASD